MGCEFWRTEFHGAHVTVHDQIQIQFYQVVRQQGNETKRRDAWSTGKQKPARILACGLLHRQAESGAGSAEMNHLKNMRVIYRKSAQLHFSPSSCRWGKSLLPTFRPLYLGSPGNSGRPIPDAELSDGSGRTALLPVSHQKHRPSALHTCWGELSQAQAAHAFGYT